MDILSVKGLITRNILPLLYYKTKLYRLKIKTNQKNLTISLHNKDSSQNSILFLASASKIQNNGVWAWREKIQLLLVYFIFIILQYFYLLYPPYLARFLCIVSFSRNVFFSLCISIANTLALIFITFQLGYYSHPLLVFQSLPLLAPTCSCHIDHYSCHIDRPVNTKVHTWTTYSKV